MSYTTMEHHIKGEWVGRISELYFILCFCEWLSNSTRFLHYSSIASNIVSGILDIWSLIWRE
jgi:hypothetical protein